MMQTLKTEEKKIDIYFGFLKFNSKIKKQNIQTKEMQMLIPLVFKMGQSLLNNLNMSRSSGLFLNILNPSWNHLTTCWLDMVKLISK